MHVVGYYAFGTIRMVVWLAVEVYVNTRKSLFANNDKRIAVFPVVVLTMMQILIIL